MASQVYIHVAPVYMNQFTPDRTNNVHANGRTRHRYLDRHLDSRFRISIAIASICNKKYGFVRSYFVMCMSRLHFVHDKCSIQWSAFRVLYRKYSRVGTDGKNKQKIKKNMSYAETHPLRLNSKYETN